eukprot:ANDGO_08137.mRNA.1 UPF0602 protein C4orf47 homolog OS=Danio rerio GN=zgc:153146 PE=2 SV=1
MPTQGSTSLLHGSFGDSTFISIGDPYDKKTKGDERIKGKQFVTNPPKKGVNTTDVLFEKQFRSLFVGEKYTDQSELERKWRKEAVKKMIGRDFRPVSNPKKSAGPGNYIGTFSGTIEYIPSGPQKESKKAAAAADKKLLNFRTNPPKKGGFGVPGTTFEKLVYAPDPGAKATAEKSESAAKGKPFKASFPVVMGCFHPNPYKIDKELPPKKDKSEKKEKEKVFRPTASSHNLGGTINKFPEYKPEPYQVKPNTKKDDKAKVFRPGGGSHSGFTRSIAYHVL